MSEQLLGSAIAEVGRVLKGKDTAVKQAIACLLAKGHLLIEDLPGLGKTTLAHAIAAVTGLGYRRVQFTSDMLPADLTGFSLYDQTSGEFKFQRGPVFCQLMLADEINRSSPKTQSALLEAMEEYQVSVDGQSYPLPSPFFVIATQNPFSLSGTFPLPESQLDRFLMRISMGYPDRTHERDILSGDDPRQSLSQLDAVLPLRELELLQAKTRSVHVSDAVLDYVQRLLDATRNGGTFIHGISPRGGIALLQCARAWAVIEGRDYVSPDDVQAVVPAVFGHRLQERSSGAPATEESMAQWIEGIDVLGV